MREGLKVYVGFALTGAPHRFIEDAKDFQENLRSHVTVLDFWKPKDRQAVEYCLQRVADCDAMIAIVTRASFGLGYEVATALNLGKRVLMVADGTLGISDFATENPHPNTEFNTYTSPEELMEVTMAFLEKL